MEHTPFAGLTALDENDPITIDGASFLIKNPRITDHLLQIGAVTHRHDQHGILPNPHVGPTAQVIPSAGTIAASTTLAFTYTVADNAGGETAPAPPVVFVTGGQVNPPTIQPSAQVINGSGIMPAGNYYYGLTYTDGDGGETSLGPPILVSILPGNASASVLLGGLASELHANGPVDWRLWRSYEGADWHLVTQGSANTFLDDGFDPPDDPARPPDGNTTMGTFSVAVTIPALDPAFATGTAINLYLAPDTTFSDPCFLMQVPIASAGHTILITDESVTQGSPPAVTTCVPGAHQIYPDTELVWGVKSPVANSDALPASATIGDVRLALDTDILWGYTPQGWVELGAAGTWKSPVVAPSALPISVLNRDGDARVTTSTDQIWLWNKGAGFDLDYVPLDAIENQVTDGNPNPLGNVGSGWVTDTATDSQYIYWTWSEFSWTGSGRIGRVRLDGTGADPFWVHQNNASGITNPGGLDDDATYVYYANDRSVGRVNKDGTGLNSFFVVSTEFNGGVVGVAVDDTYLYIATFSNGIWRCNKSDGSNLIALHHAPAQPPGLPASIDTFHVTDIAVDDTYVYWSMQFEMTDPGVGGSGLVFSDAGIGRCHKDGTNVQSPWVTTAEGDKGGFPMTVETVDGAVYFGHGHYTDRYGSFLPAIGVVNPDGSGLKIDALTAPVGSGSLTALSFGAGDFFFALTHINEPQRLQEGIDGISSYGLGGWSLCNCGGGSGGIGMTSFVASAGNASANIGPFLGFAASGGASVQLVASGGSAVVLISASGLQGPQGAAGAAGAAGAPGAQGPPGAGVGVGGSGRVPLIDPASYVEFVASGGASVGITDLGGGSARVSITAAGTGGGGAASGVAGRAYRNAALSITGWGKIPIDTLDFGTMDIANTRFVAPSAGIYRVDGAVTFQAPPGSQAEMVGIYVNGTLARRGTRRDDIAAGEGGYVVSDLVQLASGDHVELYAFAGGTTALDVSTGSETNYLSVSSVGGIAGPQGASGAQGPQGAQGTQGVQGVQGPAGAGVGVGGSAVTPLIDPASYIEFVASGGATVGVTDLGGGSARVSITAAGTGGATSFVASAGNASATIGPFLGFAGSGGTSVELIQQGTSAIVLISASGAQGPQGPQGVQGAQGPAGTSGGGGSIAIAASGGASAVNPASYVEFAASGGIGLALASTGVGSAQVLIGPPLPAVGRVGAGPGTYEVYAAAKFPYAYSQGVDGSLTLGQTGGTLNTAGANVVRSSPDGQHIYVGVAVANTNNLVVFRRNADNTLTSIQTLSIAGTIAGIEISPDGQFVYVGATSLTVYQRAADGTLTLTGSSYSGSPGAALAISPNGQFLFAYDSSNVVTSYSRNLLSGTLRSVNTLTGLAYPQAGQADLVVSPDGLNLYASQGSPNGIRQIAVSTGGTLTSLGNMTTTNNNIGGMVISPDGNDLYAVSWNTHSVGHYTRSSLTGQLTFVANVTVTNFGVRMAISPDGRYVYCSVVSAQGVVTFSRAQSGGALTVVQQTAPADGASWASVTVAPTLGAIKPTDVEFVGSGGMGVTVASGAVPGGSAVVRISSPPGGLVTLVGGTVVVNDSNVTATNRILLTAQDNNSTGALRVSARTAGTSFTITSSNAGDSGVVAYQFFGT